MGCRGGGYDLAASVGVLVALWAADHRIEMPLEQEKIERPRGSSTVMVGRLSLATAALKARPPVVDHRGRVRPDHQRTTVTAALMGEGELV